MAIFARAFLHSIEADLDFDTMAEKLATIDWHLLDRERGELPEGPAFRETLLRVVRPIWASLLIVGEDRYRVSSSSSEVDAAWSKITEELFRVIRPHPTLALEKLFPPHQVLEVDL
jgi:hypothetical protein